MYKIEYMDLPKKRKAKTIELMPNCFGVFSDIEKLFQRNPEDYSVEYLRDGKNTIRAYETVLGRKQQRSLQIPRIRIRFQCYPDMRVVLIDQLAIYDHELNELDFDDD